MSTPQTGFSISNRFSLALRQFHYNAAGYEIWNSPEFSDTDTRAAFLLHPAKSYNRLNIHLIYTKVWGKCQEHRAPDLVESGGNRLCVNPLVVQDAAIFVGSKVMPLTRN
jgi:hypothetical protein